MTTLRIITRIGRGNARTATERTERDDEIPLASCNLLDEKSTLNAGSLKWRCRNCGLIFLDYRVPDILRAVQVILAEQRMFTTETWERSLPYETILHACPPYGHVGVADLIGAQRERKET